MTLMAQKKRVISGTLFNRCRGSERSGAAVVVLMAASLGEET